MYTSVSVCGLLCWLCVLLGGWRGGRVCMCVVSECACMCMRVVVVTCVGASVSVKTWICGCVGGWWGEGGNCHSHYSH